MYRLLFIGLFVFAAACSSNARRIDDYAGSAGLIRSTMRSGEFTLVTYEKRASSSAAPLFVYLDGDGLPWSADGRTPGTDPTSRHPVALKLMTAASDHAVYLSRPCYQGTHDAACTDDAWTGGRYSAKVVTSMRDAVRTIATREDAGHIVLVGYSGGGVLAVLLAERLENVVGVITVAANLDVEAWVEHHGYLPLTRSLDPARSELSHPWPEFHLTGERDSVVPFATTRAYFERYPAAQVRSLADYDHVCCWVDKWPELLSLIGFGKH